MSNVAIIVQPQTNPNPSQKEFTEPAQQLSEIEPGLTAFSFLLGRLKKFNPLWPVIVSISEGERWAAVAEEARKVKDVTVILGKDKDRLSNFHKIVESESLDAFVRWTGDSFGDAQITNNGVNRLKNRFIDLVDNLRGGPTGTEGVGFPMGFNYDVVRSEALIVVATEYEEKGLLLESDRLHAGVPTIREFSNDDYPADHFTRLTAEYLNAGDHEFDPKAPSLNCATPQQFETLKRLYHKLGESGIDPYKADIYQAMNALMPFPETEEASPFSTKMSTKKGTTMALFLENHKARMAGYTNTLLQAALKKYEGFSVAS